MDQHTVCAGGRPPVLAPAHQQELDQAIDGPAPDGGVWTGPKATAWIAERTGRRHAPQLGWAYLQKLDFVLRQCAPDVPTGRRQGADKPLLVAKTVMHTIFQDLI